MNNVKLITNMEFARELIASATDAQLRDLCASIGVRLFQREKQTAGIASANFEEAGNFLADAVRNIQGAISAEPEQPCTCGKCADCAAARSDELYGRRRDAQLISGRPA